MHVVTQGGESLRLVPVIFVHVLCGFSLAPYFKTALHRDRTPLNCHSLFNFFFSTLRWSFALLFAVRVNSGFVKKKTKLL